MRLWIGLICLWNGQQGLQGEVLPPWQGRPLEKQTTENRMDQWVTTLSQNVTDVCPRPCFTMSCKVSLCLSSPSAKQKNQISPIPGHNKGKHMESCKHSCKQTAISNKDKLTKAILQMPGLPSVFKPSPFKLYLETTTTEGSCPSHLKRTIPQELPSAGSVPALKWSLDRFQAIWRHTKAMPSLLQVWCTSHKVITPILVEMAWGICPAVSTVGAKFQVMYCHAGVSTSCCVVPLALNYFLFLAEWETQLVPPEHRREKHGTKGTETIESRAKEAWFPMDLCLASWADSDPSCSHLLPLLTAPPLPFSP